MPDDAIARLTRLSQQRYLQSRDRRLRGTGVVRPQERDAARGTYRATTETGGTINAHLLSNVSDNQGRSLQWDGQAIQGKRIVARSSTPIQRSRSHVNLLIAGCGDFAWQILAAPAEQEKIVSVYSAILSFLAGKASTSLSENVKTISNTSQLDAVQRKDVIVFSAATSNQDLLYAIAKTAHKKRCNLFVQGDLGYSVAFQEPFNRFWIELFGIEYCGHRTASRSDVGQPLPTPAHKYPLAQYVSYTISDNLSAISLGEPRFLGTNARLPLYVPEVIDGLDLTLLPNELQLFSYDAWQSADEFPLHFLYGDLTVPALWIKRFRING